VTVKRRVKRNQEKREKRMANAYSGQFAEYLGEPVTAELDPRHKTYNITFRGHTVLSKIPMDVDKQTVEAVLLPKLQSMFPSPSHSPSYGVPNVGGGYGTASTTMVDMSDQYARLLQAGQLGQNLQSSSKPILTFDPVEEEVSQTESGKQFDEQELQAGAAKELRRVVTPRVNEKFDAIRLSVDTVLVVNKLVEIIERLELTCEGLQNELDLLLDAHEARLPEPESVPLPTLADSYKDVSG
jgi:hypothetical protein